MDDADSSDLATPTIDDHAREDTLIHTEQVELAYGAVLGPDNADVKKWMTISLNVVS